MKTRVRKPAKSIKMMGYADFECTNPNDLTTSASHPGVVGSSVHLFVNDKDTGVMPVVSVKCGALIADNRFTKESFEYKDISSPEDMMLRAFDCRIDRLYFHNSRYDLAFILAWFYANQKNGYVTLDGNIRLYVSKVLKGKQGMVYDVSFRYVWRDVTKSDHAHTMHVWDSAKIWKASLHDLSCDFDPTREKGLRKGATTGGSRAMDVGVSDEMREYCLQDCRVIRYVMNYYFEQVEEFCGQPNGFMTAAATTYNMALHYRRKQFAESLDARRVKAWSSILSEAQTQEYINECGDLATAYADRFLDAAIPTVPFFDDRKAVRDDDGNIIRDEKGNIMLDMVKKGEFSWMRDAYKGSTPLLYRDLRFSKAGLARNIIIKDVNSMFPTQMVRELMPVGRPTWITPEQCLSLMATPSDDTTWIASIRITMRVKPGHRATYLSRKQEEIEEEDGFYMGKAIPVLDDVVITICEPEYRMILNDYDIYDMEVVRACSFKAVRGLFAGYINYWYDIKSTTKNPALKAFAKLMINSFYGKFGSNPLMEQHEYTFSDGRLGDRVADITTDSRSEYYLPLAMWTTAYARKMLSDGCNALGWENVIYTDTDSWHIINLNEEEATARLASVGIGNDDSKLGDAPTEQTCALGAYIRNKGYIHFNEDGNVTILKGKNGKEDKKDIKMAGANEFPDINTADDLTNLTEHDGRMGVWGYKLRQYNVIGGVLLMPQYVNILDEKNDGLRIRQYITRKVEAC